MLRPMICVLWFTMASIADAPVQKSVPIILDTDMGPDYDDVGAITMLHAFADRGEAHILATMASTKYECVACVLDVFNTYFKRPGIPIGVPKGEAVTQRDWQHWTDTLVSDYPHRLKTNSDAANAVELYRQILSAQPDHSVTIVTTGFLTNLAGLLQSPKDTNVNATGKDLVAKKVKLLVCMAGRFPEGYEFNVDKDLPSSSFVFSNWPTNIIFSGFEIGMKIKVGLPLVHNQEISHSPVKDVFRICIPMAKEDSAGRMSWDETAVLVAVRGVASFYHLKPGHIQIFQDGRNGWSKEGQKQGYLIESSNPRQVETLINQMLMHRPEN